MAARDVAGGQSLFVYYKVRDADVAAVYAGVRAMHANLQRTHPGLHVQLLRRPDSRDGLQTWMETYVCDAGVQPGLAQAIEEAALRLAPLMPGGRHCEVFEPVSDPAGGSPAAVEG